MAKAKRNKGQTKPKTEASTDEQVSLEKMAKQIEEAVATEANDLADTVSDGMEEIHDDGPRINFIEPESDEIADAMKEAATEEPDKTTVEENTEAATTEETPSESDLSEASSDDASENSDESATDAAKDADTETEGTLNEPDQKEVEDALEVEPEPEPEPVEAAAPPVAPVVQEKPRSIWPMAIAGVLVAGLGYMAGRGDVISNFLPPSWRPVDNLTEVQTDLQGKLDAAAAETAAVAGETEALKAQIAELQNQIAALPAPADLTPVTAALDEASARIEALEARPIATEDGEVVPPPDYSGAFNELKEQSEAQQAKIQALLDEQAQAEADAAEAAKKALARTALGRIQAALDAGQPFSDALAELAATGVADVPAGLSDVADEGVTTLGELQVGVSDAARDALAAARSAVGTASGVAGFFERQLGVRSLQPRDGDDPDAVLSRVVATMKDGDLNTALSEAEQLPDEAKDAMSDWLTGAQARMNATAAAATLSDSLATN